NDIKELFSDIPKEKSYFPLDKIPSMLHEDELIEKFNEYGKENEFHKYKSFLGGGAYNHFIPEAVKSLSTKGDFLTPYTPYQPEVSQGSLQAMFEYQTMMSMLTGMDISNSSLYDGGTASAEGVLLMVRKSRKKKILAASNIHPEYLEIINSYIQNLDISIEQVDFDETSGKVNIEDLRSKLGDDIGGLIFQSPNFFGVIEDTDQITETAHNSGIITTQIITEAFSLPFLSSPGSNGVDIVVGEAQSFGLPLSYGGPFLGFISAKKEFVRQIPGRLVGETIDSNGNRGYVLTLSTREQHIKREKATSNICSNQAWCALRASIYLTILGEKGLNDISKSNHLNTAYFVKQISGMDHIEVKFKKDFFNEVVIDLKDIDIDQFMKKLKMKGILPGIPLNWFFKEFKNHILVNFTEMHKKADIDNFVNAIGELK
ncbi:MAG: aminomethyl-transferring glycine dehydrogenase subunit GcvPA, partial [Candidatus Aminicenantes bacterium]|nr:aminomethyl-transferring glycine dehydrogenase subunit GcvPA [Candidatus Aminicenantes bacterium]